ncbi:hypothetical protein P40081_04495 [Paenibacillus sp. FSL P4-0081]|uniref:hypothetical protein n=1 Tax=Paenibacillus sp. FSL P4-0081 TaxID=1536769 RepID=UPI0004F5857C|nr:hypothetical protein [Paenibacillus sp. FSL P4-0081]AIQ27544.1 hypothetical protein P40081_04495 [Paenibacillus sp. FSL P4-0081]
MRLNMRLKMQTKKFRITLLIAVLSCSLVLTSCEAITAQKISSDDFNSRSGGFPGMNGGTNFNGGGRGMDQGGTRRGGSQGTDRGTGSSQQ